MRSLSAGDAGPVKVNTRANRKMADNLQKIIIGRGSKNYRLHSRIEPFELLERLELFTAVHPHGIATFLRMLTASFGALRIEPAIFPASSPTKRGGDPWLFSHSLRNAGSLLIAWNACLSSVRRLAGVLGEKAMIRVNE